MKVKYDVIYFGLKTFARPCDKDKKEVVYDSELAIPVATQMLPSVQML